MLTGDSIDNIPGCKNPEKSHHSKPPNFSAKEAYLILKDVKTELDAFIIIRNNYAYTYQDNWYMALLECADLLWICKSKSQTGRQYLKAKGFM
jgi:hypothetical protein